LSNDKDLRVICQVCGNEQPKSYHLHLKEDGVYHEMDSYSLCEECGEKFVNGLQVAVPDIVEGRKEDG
jgi:hypothetical protein